MWPCILDGAKGKNVPPFELSEEKFVAYGDDRRLEKAPATQVESVRQALALATSLMELNAPAGIFSSHQAQGFCLRGCMKKRITEQSRPLSQQAIRALEEATVNAGSALERVLAGTIRFCLGARMRGADMLRVCVEPNLDLHHSTGLGYVDVAAHVTKMSRVKLHTCRMGVESTAHSWGLHDDHWAEAWLQARKDTGINATKLGFMLPSVGPGGFTKGQMATEELAVHLRQILVKWGISAADARLYTSHSLKCTLLSYAAKIGLPFKVQEC